MIAAYKKGGNVMGKEKDFVLIQTAPGNHGSTRIPPKVRTHFSINSNMCSLTKNSAVFPIIK